MGPCGSEMCFSPTPSPQPHVSILCFSLFLKTSFHVIVNFNRGSREYKSLKAIVQGIVTCKCDSRVTHSWGVEGRLKTTTRGNTAQGGGTVWQRAGDRHASAVYECNNNFQQKLDCVFETVSSSSIISHLTLSELVEGWGRDKPLVIFSTIFCGSFRGDDS